MTVLSSQDSLPYLQFGLQSIKTMIFKTMAINYEKNTRSQYEFFDRQTSFQLKMLIISKKLPIYIQRASKLNK